MNSNLLTVECTSTVCRYGNILRMATRFLSPVLLALLWSCGVSGQDLEASKENLRRLLTDHFATPRHHVTNPAGLEAAKTFIYDTWKGYHMQVGQHRFTLVKNGEAYEGTNLFAIWPGRKHMTADDKIFIVTAHYESPYNMPGVEDNGSGLAAMMEAARVLTSQRCIPEYTVVFTAFDFNSNVERDAPVNPCPTIGCGCRAFLRDILLPFLAQSAITSEDIQGVLVLDGLLNYNNTAGAQVIPAEDAFKTQPGFIDAYNAIVADGYRGNFISVVRREHDASLAAVFNTKFDEELKPQFKRRTVTVPFYNITEQITQNPLWPLYRGVTDTDIRAIYDFIPEAKALFITDSLIYRGREKEWFSLTPDDVMTITDDRLNFLKKTTDAVTKMVLDLSGHKNNCNDPLHELPPEFKSGFAMKGTLGMPDGTYQDISLSVPWFSFRDQSHGLLIANISSKSWWLLMGGRYDSVEHMFHFHHSVPLELPGAPATVSCSVFGRFHPEAAGVAITGRMRGTCSPTLVFPQEHPGPWSRIGEIYLYGNADGANSPNTGNTPRPTAGSPASGSGPSLAAPVVLSLLGGMLLSAAAAGALWFVYKRRQTDAATNSIPMKEGQ